MSFDARGNFVGIVTAVGEVTAPTGGLVKADNVTLRRQGALSLRQHWDKTTEISSNLYSAFFWFKGSLFFLNEANALRTSTGAAVTLPTYPLGNSYAGLRGDVFTWEESRGNLYLPASRGVYKVTSGASTTSLNTGHSPTDAVIGTIGLISGTTNILPDLQQVAYRVVAKSTDANGVILRSRPTGAVPIANTSGGARAPQLQLYLDTLRPTNAPQEVEIYRTRMFPNAVQVDDEMQLVATLKASVFTAGSYTWVDTVPDIARTTTLYTSPSRGGIENANDRPPGAACIEGYRGHLFFGNIAGPQRFIVSYKFSPGLAGVATGVGSRNTSGTLTSGSTTVTGIASITGIERGMVVQGTAAAQNPWVTNIVGTTITLSSPAGFTGATGLTFYDSIGLDGQWFALGKGGAAPAGMLGGVGTDRYTSYEITPPQPGYDVTLVIEHKARGQLPFQVLGTHGGEMSPPLAVYGGTGTPSTGDTLVHGLAWSEPDEPEHVPPKNFARVGDGGKAILGLSAMRDSLLIWKEDGLFRLTGSLSSSFRIDPFDPVVQCILPGSIRRVRDSVFALATVGIVRVTEAAANIVSAPIGPDIAACLIEPIRAGFASTGLYKLPGIHGCVCGGADEGNGEYWLILGSTWFQKYGLGAVLVYAMERQGFTSYTFYEPDQDAMLAIGQTVLGQPAFICQGAVNEISSATGASIRVFVLPHGYSSPGLVNKLWTHIVTCFSALSDAAVVEVTFTSSESQLTPTVTEAFDLPVIAGRVTFPGGVLMRHILPREMARAWTVRTQLFVDAGSNTEMVIETMALESRENIPNRPQTTASGNT